MPTFKDLIIHQILYNMKHAILIAAMLCLGGVASGQITFSSKAPGYKTNVQAGEKALNAGNYDTCLQYYKRAFQIQQTSYLSTLRAAACAYKIEDTETLEHYLGIAFELSWDGTRHIFDTYPEFTFLQETPFEEMIEKRYKAAAEASGYNLALMEELQEIGRTDQLYRMHMGSVSEEYGWQSPQMDSLWTLQNHEDSLNQLRIVEIFKEYGYPGRSLVGPGMASTAFMVIQHAPQELQEEYMPIITAAADAEEVSWRSVALLIDRVRLGQGKKQIYGSQLYTDFETGKTLFSPMENPHQIDSIRATVGLGPIQEYADRWNLKWDPEEHLKQQAGKEKEK